MSPEIELNSNLIYIHLKLMLNFCQINIPGCGDISRKGLLVLNNLPMILTGIVTNPAFKAH